MLELTTLLFYLSLGNYILAYIAYSGSGIDKAEKQAFYSTLRLIFWPPVALLLYYIGKHGK